MCSQSLSLKGKGCNIVAGTYASNYLLKESFFVGLACNGQQIIWQKNSILWVGIVKT